MTAPKTSPTSRQYFAPIFALGFRPFFLFGALFAFFSIPVWIGHYTGALYLGMPIPLSSWHTHEMIWGYFAAIITGFTFTAVRNWTGLQTPRGTLLGGFVLLWVAGRILMITGPVAIASVVDIAFLPCVAIAIGRLIVQSGNHRNLFLIAILVALSAINIFFHTQTWGIETGITRLGDPALALGLVTILVGVIGGRVIPHFTANATGAANLAPPMAIEIASLGTLALIFLMDAAGLHGNAFAALLALTAVIHILRMSYWAPLTTRHEPLLWCLPLAYLWLPIAFALRSYAELYGPYSTTSIAALHALSIGGLVGMTLAIMTRSSLGHTGRPLKADRVDLVIYVSIHLAALFRVFVQILYEEQAVSAHVAATGFWMAAFGAFLFKYGPILLRPRIDGTPG